MHSCVLREREMSDRSHTLMRMVIAYNELSAGLGSRIVRVRDLEGAGISRSSIARRCRSGGPWQRLLPGIVLMHNAPVTRDDRRAAALLHGGPGAVITGLDALQLHGMQHMPPPSGSVHILVAADRRRFGDGRVLVERTERLPRPASGRWPLAPPGRAALDAVRHLREISQIRATLAEVVQRGACTPAELLVDLNAGSRRGTATPRLVLGEVADGIRSAAEGRARRIVESSGLPRPLWNPTICHPDGTIVATPDAWFADVGLAWQIDSIEWHLTPADYARTVKTRSALMAVGAVVLHTLPQTLRLQRAEVRRELIAVHREAGRRPSPTLVAIPAG